MSQTLENTVTTRRGRPPQPVIEGYEQQTVRRRESWLASYYAMDLQKAWARAARQNSRNRARQHKVEHDLSAAQIAQMFPADGRCPILGIPLDLTHKVNSTHNSATIDRIDPDLGYTLQNCHVISNLANRGKAHMNLAQLVKLGQWAAAQN